MKSPLLLLITAVSACSNERPNSIDTRPNVLLILCDDLGYSDLGCYGGEIQTPNLDRLAAGGLRFTQFYNCAVCVTTRSSLLTGLYPREGRSRRLGSDMVTLGEVMREAGYATSLTGKWHLGSQPPTRPIDRGFDEYYGLLSGCCNFFNPGKPDPVFYNGGQFRVFAHNEQRISEFPENFYTTDAFTDHAIATIEKFSEGQRPFFVHLCYTAPHFPLHAPADDIARYRGKYSKGYHVVRNRRYQRQAAMDLFKTQPKLSPPDKRTSGFRFDYDVPDWAGLPEAERRLEEARMEVYAAMVDRLDQGIGRVLSALERCGVADNTVVMFLSDNGGCASWPRPNQEEGFREYNRDVPVGDRRGYEFVGKGWGWAQNTPFRRFKVWCYEGGIATPMIVRWPGKTAKNSITHQVGHVMDFMPTLLEIAGGVYPSRYQNQDVLPLEGKSLIPVFHGEQRDGHQSLSWALFGNRAIRQGDWKLVWGADKKVWELYHLGSDRSETSDLATQFPERTAAMARDWNDWWQRIHE